jgi:hypothetical protein
MRHRASPGWIAARPIIAAAIDAPRQRDQRIVLRPPRDPKADGGDEHHPELAHIEPPEHRMPARALAA